MPRTPPHVPTRAVAHPDPVRRVALGQAAVGFTLNSIGACLVLLARDLGRAPEALAWLAPSFGAGLLAVGAVGPLLLRRGPGPLLRLAAAVTAAGTAVLATGSTAGAAAAGAALLGTGSAGVVLVTPALLAGPAAAAHLCLVNAVSSVCGMLGPLAVGLLDLGSGHGRLALLLAVPPLVVLVVLAAAAAPPAPVPSAGDPTAPVPPDPAAPVPDLAAPVPDLAAPVPDLAAPVPDLAALTPDPAALAPDPAAPAPDPPAPDPPARAAPGRVAVAWTAVLLAVSIEFCFAIWAAARLQETGLGPGTAASVAVAFLLGMAAARFVAPALIARGVPVVPLGCLLVVAGTLAVALPGTAAVAAGLAVAGIGTAAFYPVTVARLVAVPGLPLVHGSTLGALASGTAIVVAPVVLAALGAALDLRVAYLVAVLPLAGALALAARTAAAPRRAPAATG